MIDTHVKILDPAPKLELPFSFPVAVRPLIYSLIRLVGPGTPYLLLLLL